MHWGLSRGLVKFGSSGAQWWAWAEQLACWTLNLVIYPFCLLWLLLCFHPVTCYVKILKALCLASGSGWSRPDSSLSIRMRQFSCFNLMSHLRGSWKIRIWISSLGFCHCSLTEMQSCFCSSAFRLVPLGEHVRCRLSLETLTAWLSVSSKHMQTVMGSDEFLSFSFSNLFLAFLSKEFS